MAALSVLGFYCKPSFTLLSSRKILFCPVLQKFSTTPLNLMKDMSQPIKDMSQPIKYTTSQAAKLNVHENLNLMEPDVVSRNKNLIVKISVAVFLFYFCIMREENDIDEILKGEHPDHNKYNELISLQMKLQYCRENRFPTQKIIDRITEIKTDLGIK